MEVGTLGAALVWAVLPAAVLLAIVWAIDRYEKEPLRLVLIALAFGTFAAPLLAFLVQLALGVPTSMAVQTVVPESRLNVTTPLVEEISRGLAIFAVFWIVRHEVDDLLDGILYGAVVGIGFGLAANFVSILATPSFGGDATPSLFAAMVSGLNHVFYGAAIGLFIGLARAGTTARAAAYAGIGVAVALGFHLLHDYLPWWVAADAQGGAVPTGGAFLADVPNALGLIGLAGILIWAGTRQSKLVARELREEVELGNVSADEYAVVTRPLRRFTTLTRTLAGHGDDRWRLQRRLYALEVELAFRKHHRRSDRAPSRQWQEEDAYREQIAQVRGRLAALEGAREVAK